MISPIEHATVFLEICLGVLAVAGAISLIIRAIKS
jgi:hypothetical protein